MSVTVIVNGVVCLVGTIVGILFAGGSIISIANMTVSWRGFLIVAALLVPVMFIVSGIGTWLAYGRTSMPVVYGLIALPWGYGAIFVLLMLIAFNS
jgi:hypothetical protein